MRSAALTFSLLHEYQCCHVKNFLKITQSSSSNISNNAVARFGSVVKKNIGVNTRENRTCNTALCWSSKDLCFTSLHKWWEWVTPNSNICN